MILLKKIRKNGFKWFCNRLLIEIVAPQKDLTKDIKKWIINLFINKNKNIISKSLNVIYDTRNAPITFNILEVIFSSVLEMRLRNSQFIHFYIIHIKNEKLDIEFQQYENWKLQNVIIQSLNLHEDIKGYTLITDKENLDLLKNLDNLYPKEYNHKYNIVIPDVLNDLYLLNEKRNISFPYLRPSLFAIKLINNFIIQYNTRNLKIVTIVLRYQQFDKSRNSNLQHWIKFIDYLLDYEYFPIVIPDFDNMFDFDSHFANKAYVFREACFNLHIRLALYEKSFKVIGSDGGALALGYFSKKTHIISLNSLPQNSEVATKEAYQRILGDNFNEDTFPWFWNKNNVMSFQDDSYLNIINAFNKKIK